MITNPKHGWCDFNIGNFEGHPSYLTDVPLDLLEAFIDLHTKGYGMAWFDEEGSEFSLILTRCSIFIIEEKEEKIFHNFSDLDLTELEKELIENIESNLESWIKEFSLEEDPEELIAIKQSLKQKLTELKKYV